MSLERLPTVDGIDPLKLLPLRLKVVRFGKEVRSSGVMLPSRFESERSIPEMEPPELQRIPAHLQRLVRLVNDHELRLGDGDKVFFHVTRAFASVLGEAVDFEGSRVSRKI